MNFKLITTAAVLAISTPIYADVANPATQIPVPHSSTPVVTSPDDSTGKVGQDFLEANKTKPGVVTLEDGLQYKILKSGTGPHPDDSSIVTVQYEGRFVNGAIFDSSATHGGTVDFPLGQVIPGWVEALKLMNKGASWELYIPSNLAYGAAGAPPSIGPNQVLIFKVTLVNFKKG